MNQKVTNKYLSGTAIIAVPQEEIETILKHNFHCFKDAAKPREKHMFSCIGSLNTLRRKNR